LLLVQPQLFRDERENCDGGSLPKVKIVLEFGSFAGNA
jgi:hypothetical protein